MRVTLDIEQAADGRVTGTVMQPQRQPAAFSGWLELLHVLEDCAVDETDASHPVMEQR